MRTATAVALAAAAGVSFMGYLLYANKLKNVALFDQKKFFNALSTRKLGRNLTSLQTVESTMPLIKEEFKTLGAEGHGKMIIAEEQTGGVGRRKRGWISKPGNLYVSFIWRHQNPDLTDMERIYSMNKLNFVIGVAIAQAINNEGVDTAVKWPNDVWAKGKKLAGILVDNIDQKGGGIAGFGININEEVLSSDVNKVATCVNKEAGRKVCREQLLAAICNNTEQMMMLSFQDVLKRYKKFDMLTGKKIRVHHKSREEQSPDDYDADVLGYDEDIGYLKVRNLSTNELKSLSGEEISISPL